MLSIQLISKLGNNDSKLIGRDSFLILIFVFMLWIAGILHFGLPWLNTYLADQGLLPSETIGYHLADFYPMIIAFLAIVNEAMMVGMVFGFMLIDEKDDNTLKAMLVTPVPFKQYLVYRVLIPVILAFVFVIIMVLFINLAMIPVWQLLFIAAGASLGAPITLLFLAIFAENKLQGFAIGKFIGIAGWVIILGWFVDGPMQWLCGLFPPFLIAKAYWLALENNNLWWLALVLGILLQLGLIVFLIKRFQQVAYHT